MKIKVLRIVGLIGLLLFFATLISFMMMGLFLPPLLVTLEFAATARPFAIILSIFAGLSLIFVECASILQRYKASSKKRMDKYISKQKGTLLIIVLSSFFIGYLMYSMAIDIPASLLHNTASKETVQLEARATSAWPARKDLRRDCQHHLLFDAPKISSEIQFVCINEHQWLNLQGIQYPVTITLRGKSSYYGYELRYQE